MKTTTLFIFTFLFVSAWSQETIFWEPEISVSDGSTYGNVRPRIVLAADDTPVVVYGKSGGILHTSRWNGSSFNTPVPLLPAGMSTYLANWTGPDMASKGDTIVVVFKANPMDEGHIYTVRSTDGGITFSDTIRADNHDEGAVWLPALEMDENGNPTVIYMARDANEEFPRYVVNHSTDAGISYVGEQQVAAGIPEEACDCCPAEYLIDGNREVLLFRNNDANVRDIFGVYSMDGGNTFPESENVNQLGWVITSCPSTGPDGLFINNGLLTVSMSKASGENRVYISQNNASTDLVFQSQLMMTPPTNSNGSQNFPRITGDYNTAIMAWQESETSNNEIFCSWSSTADLNDLLTNKHQVNTVSTGTQSNPDVIFQNGYIHLVYQDGASGDVIYRRGYFTSLSSSETTLPEISIYPNPSNGTVYIDGDFQSVVLTDLSGRTIPVELTISGAQTILNTEAEGTFLLQLQRDNQTTVTQIQLQR